MDNSPELPEEPSEHFAKCVEQALSFLWAEALPEAFPDRGPISVVAAGPVVVATTEKFSYVMEIHAVRKGAL